MAKARSEIKDEGVAAEWAAKAMPALVKKLASTCRDGEAMNSREGHMLPDRDRVYGCLDRLFQIVFPGFFGEGAVPTSNLSYFLGDQLHHVCHDLTEEAERAFHYDCRLKKCRHCDAKGRALEAVSGLLERLPAIRELLKEDMQAAYDGDPAARSLDAIVLSYPGIEAIATHRLAHELYLRDVPLIPRMWSERAHSRTGIDINPGARIGPRFFIDHGTGVVIGETCEIGRNVAVYQGVTLGALAPAKGQSLRGQKRHPTIEDDVILYAGATILGGETVIGKGCVIGGNVWLTESVPAGTKVLMPAPDLVFLESRKKKGAARKAGKKK